MCCTTYKIALSYDKICRTLQKQFNKNIMEIKLDKSHYGCNLIIEADNVKIVEDIEKRTYSRDDNGKLNEIFPERDIEDSALKMFSQVLEDMIYYRKSEFDSSSLIDQLFGKLPIVEREKLLSNLNRDYAE